MGERKEMTRQINMSWNRFDNAARKLAKKIQNSKVKISSVYGNPRGGLILAVRLSHLLNVPLITETWKADVDTLFVDEIIDTGKQMKDFCENFKVATIWINPQASFIPDFYVLLKPHNSWIVFPWERK